MRLLVVEDDDRLAAALVRGLQEEGYLVDRAADGEEAILFAAEHEYEVMILDRKLPRLSGDQVLSRLRKQENPVPILMLTALDAVEDRVQGLNSGADDYLGKPFAFEELLARIQVLQRRRNPVQQPHKLEMSGLVFNLSSHEVAWQGVPIELTPREYRMLEVFMRRPEQLISRERLAEHVWDEPWEVQDNTIDAHVKNLRKKIESFLGFRVLHTIRGFGYKLVIPSEDQLDKNEME
jgi:DNA-binding response OmpR family regulator